MKDIKRIKFDEEPVIKIQDDGFIIIIDENTITYQKYHSDDEFCVGRPKKEWNCHYVYDPVWETKTNLVDFKGLAEIIEDIFKVDATKNEDSFGTIITIEYSDGSIREKYIEGSFFSNKLEKQAFAIQHMLRGLEKPPFLGETKKWMDDYFSSLNF